MVLKGLAEDEGVVQIWDSDLISQDIQTFLHTVLEGCWCIYESKRNLNPLIQAPEVTLGDMIFPGPRVKTRDFLQGCLYPVLWLAVRMSLPVQPPVVYAQS